MYILSLIIGTIVVWLVWTTLKAAWLTFLYYGARKRIAEEEEKDAAQKSRRRSVHPFFALTQAGGDDRFLVR